MKKKTALITGACRGIGYEIAKELACDHNLILCSNDKNQLESTVSELKSIFKNTSIATCCFDISKKQNIEASLKSIEIHSVDILVNNAGILAEDIFDTRPYSYEELIKVNQLGSYYVLERIVPVMKKNKSGYIFNIASMAGTRPAPNFGAYSSTKYALMGLSENLSRYLAPYGIKVTAICPSVVDTEMTKELDIENKNKIIPSDITKVIRLCLSLGEATVIEKIEMQCLYLLNQDLPTMMEEFD